MTLYGVKYDGKQTDFEELMKYDMFKKSLFIFNDNQTEHYTSKKGSGNAIMRKYNKYSKCYPPKSAGIPTGHHRNGYSNIIEAKQHIDDSFNEIIQLLNTDNYDSIVYSINDYNDPTIGTGIFNVNIEVKKYITRKIFELFKGRNYFCVSSRYLIQGPELITDTIINYFN